MFEAEPNLPDAYKKECITTLQSRELSAFKTLHSTQVLNS